MKTLKNAINTAVNKFAIKKRWHLYRGAKKVILSNGFPIGIFLLPTATINKMYEQFSNEDSRANEQ